MEYVILGEGDVQLNDVLYDMVTGRCFHVKYRHIGRPVKELGEAGFRVLREDKEGSALIPNTIGRAYFSHSIPFHDKPILHPGRTKP